jgi:hypothetical protein
MPLTPEAIEYINSSLAAGVTLDEIKASLLAAGWPESEIAAAFAPEQPPAPATEPAPMAEQLATPTIEQAPATAATGPKSKHPLRLGLMIAGAVIILAGGAFLFLHYFPSIGSKAIGVVRPGNDDPTVNDSDLQLAAVNLSPDQNAYYEIEENSIMIKSEAARKMASTQFDFSTGWDAAAAKELSADKALVIAAFLAAAARPEFQNPHFADPDNMSLAADANFSRIKAVSSIVMLDAYGRAADGDIAGGLEEAWQLTEYGRKMASSQQPIVMYLGSIAVMKNGLKALQAISELPNVVSDPAVTDFALRLNGYGDTRGGLGLALEMEYLVQKKEISDLPAQAANDNKLARQINDPFLFERNKTLNALAEIARKNIALATENCREFSDADAPAKPIAPDKDDLSENAFGKGMIYGASLYKIPDIANRRCELPAMAAAIAATLSR